MIGYTPLVEYRVPLDAVLAELLADVRRSEPRVEQRWRQHRELPRLSELPG